MAAGKPPVRVRVEGVDELKSGARRLFREVDDEADGKFKTTADQLATIVKGRVPHRSGRLASSIHAERRSDGASVGYNLIYAGPVDFGGYPGSRPYYAQGRYLYPLAEDHADAFGRAGDEAAKQAIRGFHWPSPKPW